MALHILGPEAFRPAFVALVEGFAAGSERPTLTFGAATGSAASTITSRLAAGEAFDIVFLPAALTDQQIAAGRIAADSRVDVMRSMVALCVRAGAAVPDITTFETLRETLLAASSIGLSQAGSGVFARDVLLPRLGLAEALGPRCHTITDQPVGAAVAAGKVGIGLQQLSELLQETGITIAAPLPEAAQGYTVIAASAPAGRALIPAQVAFLTYLRSEAAAEIMRVSGLQPIPA